jgi:hypothetical protein
MDKKTLIFVKREAQFEQVIKDHNKKLGQLWNELKGKIDTSHDLIKIVNDGRRATATASIPTVVTDQEQRLVPIRLDLDGPDGNSLKECFTWNLYGSYHE